MSKKYWLLFCILIAPMSEARAAACTSPVFSDPSVCTGNNCSVSINFDPAGVVRVLADARYGTNQRISFGERSVLMLGAGGSINFGVAGGTQAVVIDQNGTLDCTPFLSGTYSSSSVDDMTGGGWLVFSHNNHIDFKALGSFGLAALSKIDGRLDIQSVGKVGLTTNDDAALPNVDIDAAEGITLHAQGDVQIGTLQNQGTSPDNQGIHINAAGDVTIGVVDSNDDFAVLAGGNINIGEIKNADSISLTINPPNAGVIRIAGKQTTDNPVICASTDDCNGFVPEGGGSDGDSCNTVNSDPNAPNNCGGGAAGPGFLLLCAVTLLRRRIRLYKNRVGDCLRCSPALGRSV
jgi:hypothetical protein